MNRFLIFVFSLFVAGCNKNTPAELSEISSKTIAPPDNYSFSISSKSNSELKIAVKSVEKSIEEAYQPNLLISLRDFEKRFDIFSTEKGKIESARLNSLINEKLAKFNYVDDSAISTINNEDAHILSASQLKQLYNGLSTCYSNNVLIDVFIKSELLSFGSDSNNENVIRINGNINSIYDEVGKSINGENYDRISEEYYNLKIENFKIQKASLGAAQAKQNIINDIMAKFESCSELLQDRKNSSYVLSIIGAEKANLLKDHLNLNSFSSNSEEICSLESKKKMKAANVSETQIAHICSVNAQQISSLKLMDMDDFRLDIAKLEGRKVRIRGIGRYMMNMFFITKNLGDTSPINVDIARLPRDQQRMILQQCSDIMSPCNLTIEGVVAEVNYQKGIVAERIGW
jgi:hypothetical protein